MRPRSVGRRRRIVVPTAHVTSQEDPIETQSTQGRKFVIHVGNDTHDVRGRGKAVEAAKERSRSTGRPIHLERADGRVTMEFRRGELQNYRYETRPRRRRS